MGIYEHLKHSMKTVEELVADNPLFKRFNKINGADESYEHSVLNRLKEQERSANEQHASSQHSDTSYRDFVYGAVSTNKLRRLISYREMENQVEIADAMDEICDESVAHDHEHNIAKLIFRNERFNDTQKKTLEDEAASFISMYHLEDNLWEDTRKILRDGEVCYENITDPESPEDGIVALREIPAETFDFLLNEDGDKVGIIVFKENKLESFGRTYRAAGNMRMENIMTTSGDEKGFVPFNEGEAVALPFSEVTYIDSGHTSSDGLMVLPVIERARKAYRQLTLIEDSIIIYRLARAPERMVFNVEVGKMPKQRVEQELQRLAHRYNSKQYYNPNTGSVTNDYDPYSMVENFFFAKNKEGVSTDVKTIGGSVQWTELPDLEHFQKKLYMSLKVPFINRLKSADSGTIDKSESISSEEAKFLQFVTRVQSRFSIGLTQSFKSHLKLKGLWDSYEMSDDDCQIKLTPPILLDEYQQQRALSIKIDNYKKHTESDMTEFSKELLAQHLLGLSQTQIEQHRERRKDERLYEANIKYLEDKVGKTGNPNDVETSDTKDEGEE
jgi:hypothetical protein